MDARSLTFAVVALSLGWSTGQAQAAALVAEAREAAQLAPAQALGLLRQALAIDTNQFEANWRAAVAAVDLGLETPDGVRSARRDSLFLEAERYARRATAIDSNRVEGHFVLGMALGRVALTKSKKDRVRYAREIFEAATRALAIAPEHDGAHHILALWHAEAMRISGFNRFMAKNLLGGKILNQASWARAISHLETAVAIDPDRIFHRLDLARVYVDRKRYREARLQLNAIAELPNRVAHDPEYRKDAARLLAEIEDRRDEAGEDSASPTEAAADVLIGFVQAVADLAPDGVEAAFEPAAGFRPGGGREEEGDRGADERPDEKTDSKPPALAAGSGRFLGRFRCIHADQPTPESEAVQPTSA